MTTPRTTASSESSSPSSVRRSSSCIWTTASGRAPLFVPLLSARLPPGPPDDPGSNQSSSWSPPAESTPSPPGSDPLDLDSLTGTNSPRWVDEVLQGAGSDPVVATPATPYTRDRSSSAASSSAGSVMGDQGEDWVSVSPRFQAPVPLAAVSKMPPPMGSPPRGAAPQPHTQRSRSSRFSVAVKDLAAFQPLPGYVQPRGQVGGGAGQQPLMQGAMNPQTWQWGGLGEARMSCPNPSSPAPPIPPSPAGSHWYWSVRRASEPLTAGGVQQSAPQSPSQGTPLAADDVTFFSRFPGAYVSPRGTPSAAEACRHIVYSPPMPNTISPRRDSAGSSTGETPVVCVTPPLPGGGAPVHQNATPPNLSKLAWQRPSSVHYVVAHEQPPRRSSGPADYRPSAVDTSKQQSSNTVPGQLALSMARVDHARGSQVACPPSQQPDSFAAVRAASDSPRPHNITVIQPPSAVAPRSPGQHRLSVYNPRDGRHRFLSVPTGSAPGIVPTVPISRSPKTVLEMEQAEHQLQQQHQHQPQAFQVSHSVAPDQPSTTSRQAIRQTLQRLLHGSPGTVVLSSVFPSGANGASDRWLVLLELADMARRANDPAGARALYREVAALRPKKTEVWLEWAKLEDECGDLHRCRAILRRGLSLTSSNGLDQTLLVRALRVEERLGCLSAARRLLSHLRDLPLERSWRTILEGALLEVRAGNAPVARKIFRFLANAVSWYGPVFQEWSRFEEGCDEVRSALEVVEEGLSQNPKYGPLWFTALRLYEKLGEEAKLMAIVEKAGDLLLRDLKWKVFFESAQAHSRKGRLEAARSAYVRAAELCPANLEWKIWHAGSRTELSVPGGSVEAARQLINRALVKVPSKTRPVVLLEQARVEEFCGKADAARAVLDGAKRTCKHEWKVFLERVLVEVRCGCSELALHEARESLCVHPGTGRLWAVYMQIRAPSLSLTEQKVLFKRALKEVPKSGELWCEGARFYIRKAKYEKAKRCLRFGVEFTPQYGDSFIEFLRAELLENHGIFPVTCAIEQECVNSEPNYGPLWLWCKKDPLDSPRQVLQSARHLLLESLSLAGNAFSDVNLAYRSAMLPSAPPSLRLKIVFGSDLLKP